MTELLIVPGRGTVAKLPGRHILNVSTPIPVFHQVEFCARGGIFLLHVISWFELIRKDKENIPLIKTISNLHEEISDHLQVRLNIELHNSKMHYKCTPVCKKSFSSINFNYIS